MIFQGCVWEVLNGVGVDGVGGIFPFFSFFFVFLRFFVFFRFSSFFFDFLRFSDILLEDKGSNCNSLQKWGISLRPRLHRPRAKLPGLCGGLTTTFDPGPSPEGPPLSAGLRHFLLGLSLLS